MGNPRHVVNVTFSVQEYEALDDLAARLGLTISSTIRLIVDPELEPAIKKICADAVAQRKAQNG